MSDENWRPEWRLYRGRGIRVYRGVVEFTYRLKSADNRRGHWSVHHKRVTEERNMTWAAWAKAGRPNPPLPMKLTFVRIAPRKLDEGDNLPSAFKAIRDEICKCLGVSDAPSGPVEFDYKQWTKVEAGWDEGRSYGVRILLEHDAQIVERAIARGWGENPRKAEARLRKSRAGVRQEILRQWSRGPSK